MSNLSSFRVGRVLVVPDEEFRNLIREMVPFLLEKLELFYPSTNTSAVLFPSITRDFFHNVTSAIYMSCFATEQEHWKPFFRKHFERMTSSLELYMRYVFYVLDYYKKHFDDVFGCLLSSMTFVLCATAYFTSNEFHEALQCPYRILVTFFESSLRKDFYKAGGNKRLLKHIDDIKIYKVMILTYYDRMQFECPPPESPNQPGELKATLLRFLPDLGSIEGSRVESHKVSKSRSKVAINMKEDVTLGELISQDDFWLFSEKVNWRRPGKPIVPEHPAPAVRTPVFATTSFQTPSASSASSPPMGASAGESLSSGGKDNVFSSERVGIQFSRSSSDTPALAIRRPLVNPIVLTEIERDIANIKIKFSEISRLILFLSKM